MTASLRGRFSKTSDLIEKRDKKVAKQVVLFSRFLRLGVGVVVKYMYGIASLQFGFDLKRR